MLPSWLSYLSCSITFQLDKVRDLGSKLTLGGKIFNFGLPSCSTFTLLVQRSKIKRARNET